MFCILYKMADEIGIKFFEKDICFPKCKYFKNDQCSILNRKENKKLTKERFGWIIDELLYFEEPIIGKKNSSTLYKSFILLIHPYEQNVWMCKYYKKDINQSFYSIFNGLKRVNFENIESLNEWLSKTKFDGRKLKESDFEK